MNWKTAGILLGLALSLTLGDSRAQAAKGMKNQNAQQPGEVAIHGRVVQIVRNADGTGAITIKSRHKFGNQGQGNPGGQIPGQAVARGIGVGQSRPVAQGGQPGQPGQGQGKGKGKWLRKVKVHVNSSTTFLTVQGQQKNPSSFQNLKQGQMVVAKFRKGQADKVAILMPPGKGNQPGNNFRQRQVNRIR